MHRGIMSICPDNFDNNFGIQQQPSLDELSFFVAGLQEQRHALDDQVSLEPKYFWVLAVKPEFSEKILNF